MTAECDAKREAGSVNDERATPNGASSVGASILWNSPLGPIRFDYAYALSKDEGVQTALGKVGKDQLQAFRFSGGSRF